jgi:hypothetical protein
MNDSNQLISLISQPTYNEHPCSKNALRCKIIGLCTSCEWECEINFNPFAEDERIFLSDDYESPRFVIKRDSLELLANSSDRFSSFPFCIAKKPLCFIDRFKVMLKYGDKCWDQTYFRTGGEEYQLMNHLVIFYEKEQK